MEGDLEVGGEFEQPASYEGFLLGTLLSRWPFSAKAMERALINAWCPLWDVEMSTMADNLFLFTWILTKFSETILGALIIFC